MVRSPHGLAGYGALRILGCGGWCWHGVGACPMIEVATLQTLGGPDMSHATLSAPDMSVIGHHVWVGGQFQERRTDVLSSGVASLAPGVAPSAGQVAAWAPSCAG